MFCYLSNVFILNNVLSKYELYYLFVILYLFSLAA